MATLVVRLKTSGMFCELAHTVAAAGYADAHDLALRPVWLGGLYSPPGQDAWPQLFDQPETPSHVALDIGNRDPRIHPYRLVSPRGPELPSEYQVRYKCRDFLAPPASRGQAARLIRQYVVPRPEVLAAKRELRDRIEPGTIGLHLRGPGRLHGGAAWLYDQLCMGKPPYEAYFRIVDRQLGADSKVLLCTDAGCVADRVLRRYGRNRVIQASQHLPDEGEPHLAKRFDPHGLAVDALCDAWLLASCSFLVHGNSNLSNFVLCLNPDLAHADIFAGVYPCC